MRTSFRSIALLAAALSACAASPALAQTKDQKHVAAELARLTPVSTALARYCKTVKPAAYVCGAPRDSLARAIAAESSYAPIVVGTPAPTPPHAPPPAVDSVPSQPPVITPTPHPTPAPTPGPIPSTTSTTVGPATVATLPQAQPSAALPTSGRAVKVCAMCNLQAAIDAAVSGDVLLLAPGATYSGNFAIPNKGSAQSWIVIRTDTTLSLAGRMTPTAAAQFRLARIQSPNNMPAVVTALGAHHWALDAIEAGSASSVTDVNAIIVFGEGDRSIQTTVASAAHDLILSRSYVHGQGAQQVHRCVMLNSASTAIVDSWLSDCHSNNNDSQAIVGWNGPGPYLIRNNHLEGGHQALFFGGADPAIPALTPSDITVVGNHLMHPIAWKGVWQVKTILETKNVRRMLVEGNVLENVWPDAQAGFAFLLKSENQLCSAPWTQTADVTIRYNRIRNAANGFNVAGHQGTCATVAAARFLITDNIVEAFGYQNGTNGTPLQILSGAEDVIEAHNTFATAGLNAISVDGPSSPRSAIHSNVIPHGDYGIKGSGTGDGISTLNAYLPGGLFAGNLLTNASSCSSYPATTVCVITLPATLPLGYDGRAVGADTALVNAKTAGAVVAP